MAFSKLIRLATTPNAPEIPAWRRNQVCYLNFADRDHPVAMNVLEDVAPDERETLVLNIVSTMHGTSKVQAQLSRRVGLS